MAPLPVPPGRVEPTFHGRVLQGLRLLIIGLAAVFVLLFLLSAHARIAYPYTLSDAGMLPSVQQVAAGHGLYHEPSLRFTPFLYTPVFFYLSALMAHLTGLTAAALRTTSALATLGCFAMVYTLMFAETRRHLAAILSTGVFAACYPAVGGWFDVARVDMVYLLVLLIALYATRWGHPVLAACLWVLAFQCKQGVMPTALLLLCHDWQRPRRVLLGVGSFFVLLAGSVGLMTHVTHGWYRYYVFGLVNGLGYDKHIAVRYLTADLLGTFGIALLLILAAAVLHPPHIASRRSSFYFAAFLGMVVFTGYVRAHRGAAENALLPAFLWISILLGLAAVRLLASWQAPDGHAWRLEALLLTAVAVQMAAHLYSPREYAPQPWQVPEREQFESILRSLPGSVLVLSHPEYPLMAGKQMFVQADAAGSVIDAANQPLSDKMVSDFADAIQARRFSAIALDVPVEFWSGSGRKTWAPADFHRDYPLLVRLGVHYNPQYGPEPDDLYLPCASVQQALQLDPHLDVKVCSGPAVQGAR